MMKKFELGQQPDWAQQVIKGHANWQETDSPAGAGY
jgi:hypothetical protein